ncbi:hypothetical protein JCM10449v2_002850 [Rhodotorula kratochvilovae]
MDTTITIRTADDPPVELSASRAVLAAGSKVFADMLSLPQGDSDSDLNDSIDIYETKKEFAPFLRLLSLAHDEGGNPLKALKIMEWPVAARLADKYDAEGVRAFALCKYWENQPFTGNTLRIVSSFEIAVALRRAAMVKAPAFLLLARAHDKRVVQMMDEMAPQFAQWKKLLKLHAFECSVQAPPRIDECPMHGRNGSTCSRLSTKQLWITGVHDSMAYWRDSAADSPFNSQLGKAIRASTLCTKHQARLQRQVKVFEQRYRDTAPEFPL